MFDDLGYSTRVEHVVFKISHGEVIIAKWSKVWRLYILEGSNVIVLSSSASEDFHDKNKLWDLRLRHGEFLEVILDHFNEFYRRHRMKMHMTIKFSLSLWGKGCQISLPSRQMFIYMNILPNNYGGSGQEHCNLLCLKGRQNFSYWTNQTISTWW